MLCFTTTILRFGQQGEKSGWSYVVVTQEQANSLKPGNRQSFRVTGKIDQYPVEKIALIPMGDGSFIIPLNAVIRKAIKKQAGAEVEIKVAVDNEPVKINIDFMDCLEDEPAALTYFKTLTKGHQQYFSKWIESAKTIPTRAKRIAMAVNALSKNRGFPEMLRAHKKEKQQLGL